MLKRISRYLKDFKKDLEKLQKYQQNITYGLDYLMKKMIIPNQKKSRKPLMVVIYYMKV